MLIKNNCNINLLDFKNNSCLIYALQHCNFPLISLLIESGIDINIVNAYNESALSYINNLLYDDEGYELLKKIVYKINSDLVNKHDSLGITPIHHIFLYLKENIEEMNKANRRKIKNDYKVEAIKLNKEYKFHEVNEKVESKVKQLEVEFINKRLIPILESLLLKNANFNVEVSQRSSENIINLQNKGISYDNYELINKHFFLDLYKVSPILMLMKYPSYDLLVFMIKKARVDIKNIKDYFGNDLIQYLISIFNSNEIYNNENILLAIKYILSTKKNEINLNNQNYLGSYLIVNIFNIYLKDEKNQKCLEKFKDFIRFLVKNGVEINVLDEFSNINPFIQSVISKNRELVEFLLYDLKADINFEDKFNRNALHYYMNNDDCRQDTDYSMLNILLQNNIDLNKTDYLGRSPIFYLFIKIDENGNNQTNECDPIAVLSSLIHIKGINWNLVDVYGNSLLHYVNQRKALICHSSLISSTDIDCNIKNFEGNTPACYSMLYKSNFISEIISKGGKINDLVHDVNIKSYSYMDYLKKKPFISQTKEKSKAPDILYNDDNDEYVERKKDDEDNDEDEENEEDEEENEDEDKDNYCNQDDEIINKINSDEIKKQDILKDLDSKKYNDFYEELKTEKISEEYNISNQIKSIKYNSNINLIISFNQVIALRLKNNIKSFKLKKINSFIQSNSNNEVYSNLLKNEENLNTILSKKNENKKSSSQVNISLLRACMKVENQGMIYLLLSKGFDVFQAIEDALNEDKLHLAEMLLNKISISNNINKTNDVYQRTNKNNESLLVIFCKNKYTSDDKKIIEVFKLILSKKIDYKKKCISKGNSYLHYLFLNQSSILIQFIIDNYMDLIKAEFFVTNRFNQFPLHCLFNNIQNLNEIYNVISIIYKYSSSLNLSNSNNLKEVLNKKYFEKEYDSDNEKTCVLIKLTKYLLNIEEDKNKYNDKSDDSDDSDDESNYYDNSNEVEKYKKLLDLLFKLGVDLSSNDQELKNSIVLISQENNLSLLNTYLELFLENSNKNQLSSIINQQDIYGNTSLHYIIKPNQYGYYSNLEFVNVLLKNGGLANIKNKNSETALTLSSFLLDKKISKTLQLHNKQKALKTSMSLNYNQDSNIDNNINNTIKTTIEYNYDYIYSAVEHYFKTRKNELEIKIQPSFYIKPDTLSNLNEDYYKVLIDNDIIYDLSLIKINFKRNYYGGGNLFYKMQIIFDSSRELYLLWNRWGFIGEKGAYQRTPYYDKQIVIAEFNKIFKSKTGNKIWEGKEKFFYNKGKYSLQTYTRSGFIYKNILKESIMSLSQYKIFDKQIEKSELIYINTINEISNHSYINKVLNEYKIDDSIFNIARITNENLLEAKEILNQIECIWTEIEKEKEMERKGKTEPEKILNESSNYMYRISYLSSRYYEIIPRRQNFEFQYGNLKWFQIKKEKKLLEYINNAENAMKILIYSQLKAEENQKADESKRKIQNNSQNSKYKDYSLSPYFIIKSILNERMILLDKSSIEYNIYTKYMLGSMEINRKDINLYKIDDINTEILSSSEIYNQKSRKIMLFHGTKIENVLGILTSGMKIKPFESSSNGSLFGNGVYFSDNFNKAYAYTSNYGSDKKYAFICEVNLGNVNIIKNQSEYDSFLKKKTNSGKSYDSLYIQGSEIPDYTQSFYLANGCEVPYGSLVKTNSKERKIRKFSEYVVFNEALISLKYMIEIL